MKQKFMSFAVAVAACWGFSEASAQFCVPSPSCSVVPPLCVHNQAAYDQVVAGDPFCCNTGWDSFCQSQYNALSSTCTAPCAITPPVTVTNPGAYGATIAADPFCCNSGWDSFCDSGYAGFVGTTCASPSCAFTPPACVDVNSACYATVIANDPFCCSTGWDSFCISAYDACSSTCLPQTCINITVNMYDSFGDGWNGAAYTITDITTNAVVASGALGTGSFGSNIHCLNDGCYSYSVTGGSFPGEVSWDIQGANGGPLSGGAPATVSFTVGAGCPSVPSCSVVPPACVNTFGSCYADVVAFDAFCCNTGWDSFCQDAYDACSGTCLPTGQTCGQALPITCGVGSVSGNTSLNPNDNASSGAAVCAIGTAGQVWYSLNIPQGGQVTLSTCGGATWDTRIGVYSGSCGALACVAQNDDFCGLQSQLTFTANPGQSYLIRMGGFGAGQGAFTMTVSCVINCAPAPACVTNTAAYNTVIANDPFCCDVEWDSFCQSQYDALSNSCTVPCTGVSINMFDLFGDGWNGGNFIVTDLATNSIVWTGTLATGASGTSSTCLPDGCYSFEVTGGVFPGEISWQLNGFSGGTISGGAPFFTIVNLNTSPCSLPCPSAQAVLCGDSYAGSMTQSTSLVSGAGCSGIPLSTQGDWYVFNGTGDELTVSTCGGSANDTRIHVFTLSGDCGDPASYNCVGANDDACGLQSQVSFNTTAGVDYYIVVSAFSTFSVGPYTVNFICAPPCLPTPANDDCGTAQFMLSGIMFPGSLECAQPAAIGTVCQSPFQTWYDVWYSFASTGACGTYGSIDFNVPNVSVTAGLGFTVWSTPDLGGGTYDCNNLTAVACCGTYGPGVACTGSFFGIGLPVLPNTVYLFQVYSTDNAGDFEFQATGQYLGCTDPFADNYDPCANQNDGSCTYSVACANAGGTLITVNLFDSFGDGWNNAFYFISDLCSGDPVGSGTLVSGSSAQQQWCLFPGCYNFSTTGGSFPGEVSWTVTGGDNFLAGGAPSAANTLTIGGANCTPGCTVPIACNYDATACITNNNLCDFSGCSGCTYPDAENYNPSASLDDGSCTFDCVTACPGDFNDDGVINLTDLQFFLSVFGSVCP
jgi:hypothetical protein